MVQNIVEDHRKIIKNINLWQQSLQAGWQQSLQAGWQQSL